MGRHGWMSVVGLLASLLLVVQGGARADFLAYRHSADFDWKYEMGVMPDTVDVDGDGVDWGWAETGTGGGASVAGGILNITPSTGHGLFGTGYAPSNEWAERVGASSDFTVEARLKVISPSTPTAQSIDTLNGNDGAIFTLGSSRVYWPGTGTISTASNTDGYHVFRIAHQGSAGTYSVWRDGVLLGDSLTGSYTYAGALRFGDNGGAQVGEVDWDYVRWTAAGAYAPGQIVAMDFSDIETPYLGQTPVGVVFDDYVSNPVPGGTVVNGGTIATFPNTFTGFVSPDAANTSVSPLPDPVGVLVDSSVGGVSFADWSSGGVMSDILGSLVAQGQEITFTFVDPDDASQKATVSRVGFRFGSTSTGRVTARFFDEFGDEIFLQSLAVGQIPAGTWLGTGFASIADGIEQPLIHQVKINCAAGDIALIGSFDHFALRNNDMVFNSLTVPEPGTVTLLGIGLAALVSRLRRRRA